MKSRRGFALRVGPCPDVARPRAPQGRGWVRKSGRWKGIDAPYSATRSKNPVHSSVPENPMAKNARRHITANSLQSYPFVIGKNPICTPTCWHYVWSPIESDKKQKCPRFAGNMEIAS